MKTNYHKGKKNYDYTSFIKKTILCGFLVLAGGLFYHQIINGSYYLRRSRNNYVRAMPIPSIRGLIFDRNGIILAQDQPSYTISVIPHEVEGKKDFLFAEIARILKVDKQTIEANYRRNLRFFFTPVSLVGNIEKSAALNLVRKYPNQLLVSALPQRFYPYPFEFAHLLGYVQNAASLREHREYGYTPLERIGITGTEQYYDSYLKGKDGGDLLEVDARGNAVGFLGRKKAKKGKDIFLTIDTKVQKAAVKALGGKDGCLILLNSNSGEIISLYSNPSFNPNFFITGKNIAQFYRDKKSPLLNRATQGLFPVGSVMKPLIAVAGLEEKKINPKTEFECKGAFTLGRARFRCSRSHAYQDIYQALGNSCNVYFYNLGLILGPEKISKWGNKFGLDSQTGIDLPHERASIMPGPAWKRRQLNQPWYAGDTVNLSIGQGYIQTTPLAMTMAINAIANGGYLLSPIILKKIEDQPALKPEKKIIEVDQKWLKAVKKGLYFATHRGGTAARLQHLGLEIAGKTGTAQTGKQSHAWFIGFFPYDNPKYTISVFLEYGGSSSEAVAVVNHFLAEIKKEGLLLQ